MSDSEKVKWRVRASDEQKLYVIEFLEKHPHLVTRRKNFESSGSAIRRRELWDELTETLNSMGQASRPVDSWQKYWRDQRAFVRERHAAYMQSCKAKNRGKHVNPLNDYEKRVLALAMYGIEGYLRTDNNEDYLPNPKIKVEVDDDYQLGTTVKEEQCESPVNHLSHPQPSSPTSPSPTSSSLPDIKIKNIRSLFNDDSLTDEQSHHRSFGKRVRLDREVERRTIALLEKNDEFNREMEIKKLEVEKEKVRALKELISVVRQGFASMAGQQNEI